ncbi:MAG: hypothetical protein GWP19_10060, partial [Planctomycetia bacterium]|nr:hypothetical protein [Planctomycetia bacterium]
MFKLFVITFLKIRSILFLLSVILIIPVSAQNNLFSTIDSSLLRSLPFRGENNLYYTLFPGVTSQNFRGNDYLHIRGSRHDEQAYYINGIDIRSDYTGLPLFRIIPQALNNITIDKAPGVGMSNARAAITHKLNQGGDNYTFSINGETDKFTPLYEKRLSTYSYGYKNLTLTGGGTIPKIGTEIFIAGEKELFADNYRMFWEGFHITDEEMDLTFISDRHTIEDWSTGVGVVVLDTFTVIDSKEEILVKPGNSPSANSGRTTLNGIITQPFPKGSVSFIALYEDETKRINNTPIFHMFNQKRLPETNRNAQLYSLQGEYNFLFDLKLNLQADFLRSRESTYDPNFGDDFWKYSDSTALAQAGLPYINSNSSRDMQVQHFFFNKSGAEIVGYSKQNENYNSIKFELSKSISNHAVRFGGNYKKAEYRFFSLQPYTMRGVQGYMQSHGVTFISDDIFEELLFRNRTRGVGYNLLGKKVDKAGYLNDAPFKPRRSSIYFSDNFYRGDWTVDIGLRYDSFNSDSQVYKDSAVVNSYWESIYDQIRNWNEGLVKQSRQIEWSPRIKVEHATSEKLHSYGSFGKYVQFPQYKDVFTSKMYREILTNGNNFISDIRAWGAKPVVSFQSSFGVQYIHNESISVNAELYNVSTKNYLQTGNKSLITYDTPIFIPFLISDGKTTAGGLELSINYNSDNVKAWINYNYSKVKGTSTYPITNYPFTNTDNWWWYDSTRLDPIKRNLDFNTQHSAVGFIAYKYGEDENVLLKNVIVSALGRFDSGHPYTLWKAGRGHGLLYEGGLPSDVRSLYDPQYGNTTSWRFILDIKIDKTITIGKTGKLTFYFYTQNILNKKNI